MLFRNILTILAALYSSNILYGCKKASVNEETVPEGQQEGITDVTGNGSPVQHASGTHSVAPHTNNNNNPNV